MALCGSSFVELSQKADLKTKLLVCGFIKEIEINDTYEYPLVTLICISYYSEHDCRYCWSMLLSVNDRLDVFDFAYSKWYKSTVVQIITKSDEEDTIKTHYDGYSSDYDEEFTRNSTRIAMLNAYTEHDPDPLWESNRSRANEE